MIKLLRTEDLGSNYKFPIVGKPDHSIQMLVVDTVENIEQEVDKVLTELEEEYKELFEHSYCVNKLELGCDTETRKMLFGLQVDFYYNNNCLKTRR